MGRKSKSAIASDAGRAFAASIFVVPERAPAQPREAWKVPCIFGGCKDTFDPHGTGAAWHSTCADGRAVGKAAAAAIKAGESRDAVRERILALIAERKAS